VLIQLPEHSCRGQSVGLTLFIFPLFNPPKQLGADDGLADGVIETEGSDVCKVDGIEDGNTLGNEDGPVEGEPLGAMDGIELGAELGSEDGTLEEDVLGLLDGKELGVTLGTVDGILDDEELGVNEGLELGTSDVILMQ